MVLQVDEDKRQSFDDLQNAYVASPLTGARVPLREVAALEPVLGRSRLVRRNGVRTVTVLARAAEGALASEVLERALPAIAALPLIRTASASRPTTT